MDLVHIPAKGQNSGAPMYGLGQLLQQAMAFPGSSYSFYPPPYPMPHAWYSQPGPPPPNMDPRPPGIHPGSHPQRVLVPKISPWLEYCDRHPDRQGENFIVHAGTFDEEGYRRINQLSDRMSVEELSKLLAVGKGTADLLIQYAKEDMELVKVGTFSMELADSWNVE